MLEKIIKKAGKIVFPLILAAGIFACGKKDWKEKVNEKKMKYMIINVGDVAVIDPSRIQEQRTFNVYQLERGNVYWEEKFSDETEYLAFYSSVGRMADKIKIKDDIPEVFVIPEVDYFTCQAAPASIEIFIMADKQWKKRAGNLKMIAEIQNKEITKEMKFKRINKLYCTSAYFEYEKNEENNFNPRFDSENFKFSLYRNGEKVLGMASMKRPRW